MGYSEKIVPYINKHVISRAKGGADGCAARLHALRAKVSAGIDPKSLLLEILTALDITDPPRITVAYTAFYLVTGPPALRIESRLVGGQWCTVGTHMPGMELLCAVIRHPAVEEKLGVHLTKAAICSMAVIGELTYACKDGEEPWSQSMLRACRDHRTMLQSIPQFEPWLRALVEPTRWPKLEGEWKRLSGGYTSGDCETTCMKAMNSPSKRLGGAHKYQLQQRKLQGDYEPITSWMPHADALKALELHCTPVLVDHKNALAAFDVSPEAQKVLMKPSEVLRAHKIDLTFKWLTEKSPSYFPTPKDPGAPGLHAPSNPRYQPGLGKKAKKSFGVPHPCIGMPVGDFLGYQRASSLARPAHALTATRRCPGGVPFPEPRPYKKPRKRISQTDRRLAPESDSE